MSISNYTDFVQTTGPAFLTGPEEVVNEAVKKSYLMKQILKGKPMKEVLQGGQTIDDVIQFDDNGSYENYGIDTTRSPSNKQTTDTISIPWRFSTFNYTISDQESLLNGTSEMTRIARFHRFKRLQRIKEMAAWTAGFNGIEDSLLAVPSNADMEAAGGTEPYSIFSLVTEDTTNFHATGFTTVQTIDPASEDKWRNPVSTYDHTTPDDDTNGLIAAFDDLIEDVDYDPPDIGLQSDKFEDSGIPNAFFICSKQGIKIYKRLVRNSNDRLVGSTSPQDPAYTRIMYSGLDIRKIDGMATAAVYTSAVEATNEPRFIFINPEYLKIVFHSQRFFVQHPPMSDVTQHHKKTIYFDVWWNLFLRSRQRGLGIIAPSSPTN